MHMNAYTCTCMRIHAHACKHAYACIRMHMHAMHACACICMPMHAFACIYMHMLAYACRCMHAHAYKFLCMHMHAASPPTKPEEGGSPSHLPGGRGSTPQTYIYIYVYTYAYPKQCSLLNMFFIGLSVFISNVQDLSLPDAAPSSSSQRRYCKHRIC